ncbi:uncharacterized protein BO80DRAFT_340366, partial [Aspergillus ibericus CBS 121593]
MVGKRKRDAAVVSRATKLKDEETPQPAPDASANDIFRKFFEAQFQPLEVPGGQVARDDESEEESEEEDFEGSESGSDWSGLSGEEDEVQVEVVEHHDAKSQDLMDKRARKAFMTSKPPSSEEPKPAKKAKKEKGDDEEDATDADNLKNDLALQRLLKESHLLESASDLAPTGKNRIKALDLRMQEIGAKSSLYKQSMPSSHRRGIKAKADMKEDRRRREARENGIILEKPAPKSNTNNNKRRERGIGGSSIGKFAGGSLNLSKRDVAAIQGPRRSTKGKSKGR